MILIKKITNKIIKFYPIKNIFYKIRDKYTILYYHGIVEDSHFKKINGPNKHLFVKKSAFIEQMNYLKNNNIDVISIENLHKLKFKPSRYSVVLTFDDGYKDNIKIVYPILKKKKFPFIIYLVPKILKGETWVWWLELWNLINKYKEIKINKKKIKLNSLELKEKFFIKIKKKIKLLKIKDQKKLLKNIFKLKAINSQKKLFLNKKDVQKLLKDDLVTIGSHTNDHLSLKNFKKNIVIKQLSESKKYLEKTFNIKIKHFSYPYGQFEDIKFNEHKILKDQGYLTSVTTLEYSNTKKNPYYLDRCPIGPFVNIDDFHRKILGADKLIKKIFLK